MYQRGADLLLDPQAAEAAQRQEEDAERQQEEEGRGARGGGGVGEGGGGGPAVEHDLHDARGDAGVGRGPREVAELRSTRNLHKYVTTEILPKLIETANARKRALEKQLMYESLPKKRSSRIVEAQKIKEEEAKLAAIRAQEAKERKAAEAERRKEQQKLVRDAVSASHPSPLSSFSCSFSSSSLSSLLLIHLSKYKCRWPSLLSPPPVSIFPGCC